MQAHIGAAKAGIDSLMRHLALEWGRHGIRSNSIVPGPIDGTEGMKPAHRADRPGAVDRRHRARPVRQRRRGGAMAVVLSSPLASFVTGFRVEVDGGLALSGSGLVNRAVAAAAADQAADQRLTG